MKAQTQRLEAGTCTWYGACRFQGRDFMYQVRYRVKCRIGWLYSDYSVYSVYSIYSVYSVLHLEFHFHF